MSQKMDYFVGLDIGGTTVKSALIDVDGTLLAQKEVPSHVKKGVMATVQQLDLSVQELSVAAGIARDGIAGIGLDVPAPSSDGVVWAQANLGEDWLGKDVREIVSTHFSGTPVHMTNDGNAAAVGEYAARPDYDGSLLYVAPGTGLAGGFVLPGGRAWEGANGLALEAGHISVPHREEDGSLPSCSCGRQGCLEAWVSLVALRRRVGIELSKDENASHSLNDSSSVEEKALRLIRLAEAGDGFAISLFQQQARILGYGLGDLVRLFDPGLVVIGGGLAESSFRADYLAWILEGFQERAWPVYLRSPIDPDVETTRFEWAIRRDDSAALGMAYAAKDLFS